MRRNNKLFAWLLVMIMAAGCMTGCGGGETPPSSTSTPASSQTSQTVPAGSSHPDEVACPIGQKDTYWVAESYYDEDEEAGAEAPIDPEFWALDLLVRVDGTASFRDVHEGVFLVDDSQQQMRWEHTAEGEYLFYSKLQPEPVLWGVWADDTLSLEYQEGTLTMRREAMPQTAGEKYVPAELVGTWLMVSGETEGYQWEAMPTELSSLVFDVTSYEGPLVLIADMEERGYYGDLRYSDYELVTEVLDQPLYEGCENGSWSVRIGDESEKDENGWPTGTEIYATMVDDDTLVLQRYYTMDGYPAVSYQTYWRLPELVSWVTSEGMELEFTNWELTEYQNRQGEEIPFSDELAGLSILLDSDQSCCLYYGDGTVREGSWMLGNGGVLLLRGDETDEDPFWFGGVVSGCWVDSYENASMVYEMVLYHDGGLLRLSLESYG